MIESQNRWTRARALLLIRDLAPMAQMLTRALEGEYEGIVRERTAKTYHPIEPDEVPYLVEMGFRLRALRVERRMHQAEVSRAAGLGKATVSHIERGERRTRPETLRKICTALGLEGEELDQMVDELVAIAGPALGRQSKYPIEHCMENETPHGAQDVLPSRARARTKER